MLVTKAVRSAVPMIFSMDVATLAR
jgi:hypothetical protein